MTGTKKADRKTASQGEGARSPAAARKTGIAGAIAANLASLRRPAKKAAREPDTEPRPGLETDLRYRFHKPDLLRSALTHSSAKSPPGHKDTAGTQCEPAGDRDNERLEFLGDRVLGLVVAELLIERFPQASEGELAKRYNRLVRREACALVAQDLELGRHLLLAASEEGSGGRDKATILADACEAVLGAIFLDGGFGPARDMVRQCWLPYVNTQDQVLADPKSALQEWAQGRGLPLPGYVVIARKGPDHAPQFTAEVRIAGLQPAKGTGASKRIAEQAAAASVLLREGVWPDDDGAA